MDDRSMRALRVGSATARAIPLEPLVGAVEHLGHRFGPRLMPGAADRLRQNLARATTSSAAHRRSPGSLPGTDALEAAPGGLDALTRRGFGSYGRYWVESLRLPTLPRHRVDRGFSVRGFGHIEQVLADGSAPILVLPHLGGWEWAAAWLSRVVGVGVTAVVERLDSDEAFEWFAGLRRAYGINVVPLGPSAFGQLTAAVRRQDVVCLLADRDIAGNGIPVDLFDAPTTAPLGPAVLSYRTGAPLLPTAVYFRGRQRVGVVTAPIHPRTGSGDDRSSRPSARQEYDRLTRAVSARLEDLVVAAPEQWHLFQPNWPDQFGHLDGVPERS
jgi:KDO2-lipid IV(A) lauroyltransferase